MMWQPYNSELLIRYLQLFKNCQRAELSTEEDQVWRKSA